MIKYNLVCNDCNYSFDSWFSSSKEYDKIRDLYLLVCSKCSSKKIEKSLMSPNILTTVRKEKKDSDSAKISKIKSKIKEYQKFIKSNFEYVGDDFPYVARTIHYDKKKNQKEFMERHHPKILRN